MVDNYQNAEVLRWPIVDRVPETVSRFEQGRLLHVDSYFRWPQHDVRLSSLQILRYRFPISIG